MIKRLKRRNIKTMGIIHQSLFCQRKEKSSFNIEILEIIFFKNLI